jgi:hypothetical protein
LSNTWMVGMFNEKNDDDKKNKIEEIN